MRKREFQAVMREVKGVIWNEVGPYPDLVSALREYLMSVLFPFTPDRPVATVTPRLRGGGVFWTHLIAAAMRPQVEERRTRLFGRPTPPFDSAAKAAAWLDSKAIPDEERMRLAEETLAKGSPRPPAGYVDFGFSPEVFGSPMSFRDPQVVELSEFCNDLSRRTGWQHDVVLRHVLAGLVPRPDPKISFHIPAGVDLPVERPGPFMSATVTVYPWHLDGETWASLREKITRYLPTGHGAKTRVVRRRRLQRAGFSRDFSRDMRYSFEDGQLLDLLPIIGPPPAGRGKGRRVGRHEYWHRLAIAWHARYRKPVKPSALRMRWERFVREYPNVAACASMLPSEDSGREGTGLA